MGRPMALVGWLGGSEGSTELRKATGFWMGLGVELLEVGEEACSGAEPGVGEDTREGGLVGDISTLVGKTLKGGGKAGRVGELAAEELSSAASSCSSGTGDSVGEGLRTGDRVWAARNSLGRA